MSDRIAELEQALAKASIWSSDQRCAAEQRGAERALRAAGYELDAEQGQIWRHPAGPAAPDINMPALADNDAAIEAERARCIADLCEQCCDGLPLVETTAGLFHDVGPLLVPCLAEPIHRRVRG